MRFLFLILFSILLSTHWAKPQSTADKIIRPLKNAGYEKVQILTATGNSSSCPKVPFCHQVSVRKNMNILEVLLIPYVSDGEEFDNTKGHWSSCKSPKLHQFMCQKAKFQIAYCFPRSGELPPHAAFPIDYRAKGYDVIAWLGSEDNVADYLDLISIISCSLN